MMEDIVEGNKDTGPSNNTDMPKLTCHYVSLPKVVLTRIEDQIESSDKKIMTPPLKKPVKRLLSKKMPKLPAKKTIQSLLKTVKSRKNVQEKKSVGRPKKNNNSVPKGSKLQMKSKSKSHPLVVKQNAKQPKGIVKSHSKTEKSVKAVLKKTVAKNRNKSSLLITLPKKTKAQVSMLNKQIGKKNSKAKMKPSVTSEQMNIESSEDEFLYDELIEELENQPNKESEKFLVESEKVTSITLKSSSNNKPPTIVKGGVVKRATLPANLKPIAAPPTCGIQLKQIQRTSSSTKAVNAHLGLNSSNLKIPTPQHSTGLIKKPSPWPVSMSKRSAQPSGSAGRPKSKSASNKSNIKRQRQVDSMKPGFASQEPQVRSSASSPPLSVTHMPKVPTNSVAPSSSNLRIIQSGKSLTHPIEDKIKGISFEDEKNTKLMPKQTAKVIPLSKVRKTMSNGNKLSTTFSEEESVELADSEPVSLLSKLVGLPITASQMELLPLPQSKKATAPLNSAKEPEDPHLDLLKILTDDSDEPIAVEKIVVEESKTNDIAVTKKNSVKSSENSIYTSDSSNSYQTSESVVDCEQGSDGVRTIYEVMADISLLYPSWNLHIIPETNAFCIAQVTKGRLGLPTLKKCIELDGEFNAKVYIHQYHIKRFDGVYDSEESIIALIHEINSIKA